MGVVITDEVTLPSGMKVTGAYASFASNRISVTPLEDPSSATGRSHLVQATLNVWMSEEAKKEGKDPLLVRQTQTSVPADSLSTGVYELLYADVGRQYSGCTNPDTAAPAPAAAAASSSPAKADPPPAAPAPSSPATGAQPQQAGGGQSPPTAATASS